MGNIEENSSEINQIIQRLARRFKRRGPWKDSIKGLPPEEQDKKVAQRLFKKISEHKTHET
ncbi:MAG: hypothetical protein JXM79_11045 [Sedimentisphaerales bacterium]|nr:hypothetical protein [Sedimentisphaerales bacterium]